MKKIASFGYKTPVRRATKNITGNKVGGDLSGGEVKINSSNRLKINYKEEYIYDYIAKDDIQLFGKSICILALGGYFFSEHECQITLSIIGEKFTETKIFDLDSQHWYSLGVDKEIDLNEGSIVGEKLTFKLIVESKFDNFYFDYTNFNIGVVDYDYFINNDVYKDYSSSKKQICFPEQFYFYEEIIISGSTLGSVVFKKSCNRCQRFLPINPVLEREQLSFANHCSAKAPCIHSTFSNYKIIENTVEVDELADLLKGGSYTINENYLKSYYGHQLECKACKKFFVNSALNKLRTATQHREDSLRRRAIELLTNDLLEQNWIYHDFRVKTKKEFDNEIWLKFEKKCFRCKEDIGTSNEMNLDHTMPLSYLYPLDVYATCLCASCNNEKRDAFPLNFYSDQQLIELSKITGLSLDILSSTESNLIVVKAIKDKVEWFIDVFLKHPEYLKDREGKVAANAILHTVQKAVNNSSLKFDVLDEYKRLKEKEA
jgi:hypothetical protein